MDRLEKLQQELQDAAISRERLMRQNEALAKQYVRERQRAEQTEARIIGLKKELSDCKKMEDVSYQLRESLREEISSANARIAELEAEIKTQHEVICYQQQGNDKLRDELEQAEAQCAAMRLRFEQYARNKCKLVAQFKGKLGEPQFESGKCQGYAMSECDDEPHWFCQECPACLHNEDEEPDAGTALLDQNRRMRELIELVLKCRITETCGWRVSELSKLIQSLKAALEAKP